MSVKYIICTPSCHGNTVSVICKLCNTQVLCLLKLHSLKVTFELKVSLLIISSFFMCCVFWSCLMLPVCNNYVEEKFLLRTYLNGNNDLGYIENNCHS